MHPSLAAVWIKVGARGKKPMVIGVIYREHRYILTEQGDDSNSPTKQYERWKLFVNSWKRAAQTTEVIVMGDLNLDYARWLDPDTAHSRMVDLTKNEIETLGFHQQVSTTTRSWNGQPDSILDHVWTNAPGRLIYCKNIQRTFSDHHLQWVSFRTKEKIDTSHDFWKRERIFFDLNRYRLKMSNIDWNDFYESEDLEIKNSIFIEKVLEVLDSEAPLKKFKAGETLENGSALQ